MQWRRNNRTSVSLWLRRLSFRQQWAGFIFFLFFFNGGAILRQSWGNPARIGLPESCKNPEASLWNGWICSRIAQGICIKSWDNPETILRDFFFQNPGTNPEKSWWNGWKCSRISRGIGIKSWKNPGKILRQSCKNPTTILKASWANPERILKHLCKMAGNAQESWNNPGTILEGFFLKNPEVSL